MKSPVKQYILHIEKINKFLIYQKSKVVDFNIFHNYINFLLFF